MNSIASNLYGGVPFEWEQPVEGNFHGKAIRVVLRNEKGEIISRRLATDQEVQCVMIFQAIAWAANHACTPAHKHDPNPFDYEKAMQVSKQDLGLT